MASIVVVGGGAAGVGAAVALIKAGSAVTVVEAAPRLGGQCVAVSVPLWDGSTFQIDGGVREVSRDHAGGLAAFCDELGLTLEPTGTDISFFTPDRQPLWYTREGVPIARASGAGILPSPSEWSRLEQVLLEAGEDPTFADWSLARYLAARGIDSRLRRHLLDPLVAGLQSVAEGDMDRLPARLPATALLRIGLIGAGSATRMCVRGGMHRTFEAATRWLLDRRATLLLATRAISVRRLGDSVRVRLVDGTGAGRTLAFDHAVIATAASEALAILDDAGEDERRCLGSVSEQRIRQIVHLDPDLLPADRATWGAENYVVADTGASAARTVYVNRQQKLPASLPDVFVTSRPDREPQAEKIITALSFLHPVLGGAGSGVQAVIDAVQGRRRTWFCGGYLREPFLQEQAYDSGVEIAGRIGAAIADASRSFEAGAAVSLSGFDDFLRDIPMFAGLDPRALSELQLTARPFEALPGTVLFRQGEEPDGLYLIKRGEVDILRRVPGDKVVKVATRGPCSVIGEMGLLDGGLRSAHAVAAEATFGYFVSAEQFRSLRSDIRPEPFAILNALRREAALRARSAIEFVAPHMLAGDARPRSVAAASRPAPAPSRAVTAIDKDLLVLLPFFRTFRPAELDHLTGLLRRHDFDPGERVFERGEKASHMFVVVRGALALRVGAISDSAAFSIIGPGAIAGEAGLLDGGPHPLSCIAREPTVALAMDASDFDVIRLGGSPVAWKFCDGVTRSVLAVLRRASAHMARIGTTLPPPGAVPPGDRVRVEVS